LAAAFSPRRAIHNIRSNCVTPRRRVDGNARADPKSTLPAGCSVVKTTDDDRSRQPDFLAPPEKAFVPGAAAHSRRLHYSTKNLIVPKQFYLRIQLLLGDLVPLKHW
jgi:hypothetical protein